MEGIKAVNIIGAGLAGLSAAITLAKKGIGSNLISAQPSERAQSVLAEGGINAALDTMGENDTTEEHFADTMRSGGYLESEQSIRNLTDNAPKIVRELVRLGAPFQSKDGRLLLRNFGGQEKKRTAYAKSSTGKIIMTTLIDEARKYETMGLIKRYPHHELVGLEIEGGKLCSVTVKDKFTDHTYSFDGPAILCTGGLNGFFEGATTGTTQNTGNAAAIAFSSGAAFANLEFIQYHPTTVGISGKRMLISEAARGEGGRLFTLRNGSPWYFMEDKYPKLGNLMPRDVVSREIASLQSEPGCTGEVFLDLTGLNGSIWKEKLSDMSEEIQAYLHIDPKNTPIPVSPGIHFFMGGIWVNDRHETNIRGLFAAGEAACKYHGANRLGANSMLGAIFGGQIAAENAAENAAGCACGVNILEKPFVPESESVPKQRQALCNALLGGLGIIRTSENMAAALERVKKLADTVDNGIDRARVLLGLAMIKSAIERKESRGAHYRTDCKKEKDAFRKLTVARYAGGKILITFVQAGQELGGADE